MHSISRAPQMRFETLRQFFHSIRVYLRTSRPPKEDQLKQRSAVVEALKKPPSLDLAGLAKSSDRLMVHFKLFLRPAPKEEKVKNSRMTHLQAIRRLAGEDFTQLHRSIILFFLRTAHFVAAEWKTVMLLILASPLIFELFLQSTSLVSSAILRAKCILLADSLRQEKVLFIGDAFSIGPEVAAPYTETLETTLKDSELKHRWRILNFSSAYLRSDETLKLLPEMLKQRPAFVYISVGMNDLLQDETGIDSSASRTSGSYRGLSEIQELMKSYESSRSFRRTLQLLTLPPPFFNALLSQMSRLSTFDSAPLELLHSTSKAGAFELVDNLDVNTKNTQIPLDQKTRFGWISLRIGDYGSSEQQLQQANQLDGSRPVIHAGLAHVYFMLGQHQKSLDEIDWLIRNYRSNPSLINARALDYAFHYEHSRIETEKMAVQLLERFPHNPWFWKTVAWCRMLSGKSDAVLYIDHALELFPPQQFMLRSSFLRTRADMLARSDPQSAAKTLLESFLLDSNENEFMDALRQNAAQYVQCDLEKLIGTMNFSEAKKARIRTILKETLIPAAAFRQLSLSKHLKQVVMLCRESGARPILLSYPVAQPPFDQVSRRVAAETDTPWVNLAAQMILLRTSGKLQQGRFSDGEDQAISDQIAQDLHFRLSGKDSLQ